MDFRKLKSKGDIMNKIKLSRGFTLVELLIVVTLIGILAVVVMSALNPIEQVNKTRDAGRRADANQIVGAVERYYASTLEYPWMSTTFASPINSIDIDVSYNVSVAGVGICNGGDDGTEGSGVNGCTTPGMLATAQELKVNFGNRNAFKTGRSLSDTLYFVKVGSSLSVCFIPSSNATRTQTGNLVQLDIDYTLGTSAAVAAISDCPAGVTSAAWAVPDRGPTADNVDAACYVCVPE
jgi:prepilin-type N-terminal cleavage/methylation domain-containing protein